MASKLEPVQSKVYPTIWWDFSEVAYELENLRKKYAHDLLRTHDVRHDEREPFDWVARTPQLTMGLEELRAANGNDKPIGYYLITRAFKACGVTTDTEIAKLAGYAPASSSSVGRWDEHNQTPTVQQHIFPALCDAYCIARKEHPHRKSAASFRNEYPGAFDPSADWTVPDGLDAGRYARFFRDNNRQNIELEVVWLLLYGELDAHPNLTHDTYTMTRARYRRAVALYAALLLDGDELGDLAHVAAALVSQHIAAHGSNEWGEHDGICLSSKRGKLDFMADRFNPDPNDSSPSLHDEISAEDLRKASMAIERAALRYPPTETLQPVEQGVRAELERRSKFGRYYYPGVHAEEEPTDDEWPSD